MDSCLTLGNELPEKIHVPTKQENLLGKAAWVDSIRAGNPGGLTYHMARSLRFYGDGNSFRVVSGQSF